MTLDAALPAAAQTFRVELLARELTDEAHTLVSSPWAVIETWDVDPDSVDDYVADAVAMLGGDARLGNAVVYLQVTDPRDPANATVRAPRAWVVEGGSVRELLSLWDFKRGVHHSLWTLASAGAGDLLPWLPLLASRIDVAMERTASESILAEGREVAADLWAERVKLRGRLDNLACLADGAPMVFESGGPVVAPGTPLGRLVRARMRACGCLGAPRGLPARPCTCEVPITSDAMKAAASEPRLPAYARAVLAGLTDSAAVLELREPIEVIQKCRRDRSKTTAVAASSRIQAAVAAMPYTLFVRALAFLQREMENALAASR